MSKNSGQCSRIFDTYLQRDGILDYMQKTLVDMKDEMGIYLYNNSNILEDQIEKESTSISYDYPKQIKQ